MENEIFTIAANKGYNIINTTRGRNGYPESTGHAITGFACWEEMETFRNQHKGLELEPYILSQIYGWDFWEINNIAIHELDESAAYHNCVTFTAGQFADINEFFQDEVYSVLDGIEEYDAAEGCLEMYRKVWDVLEGLKEDEVVVMADDSIQIACIAKRHTMSFDHDTTRYTIGLILYDD